MKKINFDIPELRQLEINGHVFDILKSDTDILIKSAELRSRYADLSDDIQPHDIDDVTNAIKSIVDYIDEVLGDGAMRIITAGRPISIVKAIELLTVICKAVVDEYNETVAEKYAD